MSLRAELRALLLATPCPLPARPDTHTDPAAQAEWWLFGGVSVPSPLSPFDAGSPTTGTLGALSPLP